MSNQFRELFFGTPCRCTFPSFSRRNMPAGRGRPGEQPVIISLPINRFDQSLLIPDPEMIRDPVFDEEADDIQAAWKLSNKTWRESLLIAGAVIYLGDLEITSSDLKILD